MSDANELNVAFLTKSLLFKRFELNVNDKNHAI